MPAPRPEHALRPWLAEFAGTGLLTGAGPSAVIIDISPSGSVHPLPGPAARLALTGFLFGSAGTLISPLGKTSGAHINPIVALAFVLRRQMRPWLAADYLTAQLTGAIAGAGPQRPGDGCPAGICQRYCAS